MSDPATRGLFDAILARGPVAPAVTDRAWLDAMLEVEAALARVEAGLGIVPRAAADAIAGACVPGSLDVAALGDAAAASGNPVVPLVVALREAVGADHAHWVHHGATSQDILDSATMLVAHRAIDALLGDLEAAADEAARLASEQRETLVVARTLLQQALPTTFGAKAAGWLAGLDRAAERLIQVRDGTLAAQLGGGGGTLASLGAHGAPALAELAAALGLAEPTVPWHADRTRIAEVAGGLGEAAAAIAKPALDLVLLAQTEIGEVSDARRDRGGSSTLPQKRNPVEAVAARACALQAPGLVATLLAVAGASEHERGAGAWHAEWRPLAELLRSVGSAASWLRDALANAAVDTDRMRANVDASGGLIVAERVLGALEPALGREAAAAELAAAVERVGAGEVTLAEALAARPAVAERFERAALDELTDPAAYLGSAGAFVDRALQAHGLRREVAP